MAGKKGQKKRFWSDEEKVSICGQTCAPGVSVAQVARRYHRSRRKLHDIYQKDGSEIAAEGLRRIAQIYKIEASVRGRPPEERLAARQAQSAPLIADFRL